MRIRAVHVCLLLALAHLFVGAAIAQTDRATLEGTVKDSSGGTISGAKVSILAAATGLQDERTTNAYGEYRFPGIALGVYSVTVTRQGFGTVLLEDVEVRVGETRTLDVTMSVG